MLLRNYICPDPQTLIFLSISVCLSIRLSIYLPIYLSMCLSVWLSISPAYYLFLSLHLQKHSEIIFSGGVKRCNEVDRKKIENIKEEESQVFNVSDGLKNCKR